MFGDERDDLVLEQRMRETPAPIITIVGELPLPYNQAKDDTPEFRAELGRPAAPAAGGIHEGTTEWGANTLPELSWAGSNRACGGRCQILGGSGPSKGLIYPTASHYTCE